MFKASGFSARLKQKLSEYGITAKELAERTNIPAPTISRYATGKREAVAENIDKIASYFNVSVGWMMGYEESHPSNPLPQIPLLGTIAAGVPLLAEQNIEGYLSVPESWNVDYALRVKGESMINAGIPDKSIVLCRRQEDVDDGQIAVCIVDGDEATLKRVKRYDSILVLHPENSALPDMVFKGKDQSLVKIVGLARKVVRDV